MLIKPQIRHRLPIKDSSAPRSRYTDRMKSDYQHQSKIKKREADKASSEEHLQKLKQADLKLTVDIPQYIIDNYMRLMSPTAWKLFCYLARRARFAKDHPEFGTCPGKHKTIAEITGISASNMRKYEEELERLGLIKVDCKQMNKNGSFKTSHLYEIPYFKIRQEYIRFLTASKRKK